ncbi:hypothetical protein [Halorussus amylolyticus]|uniref:hypothetical protein n=1 Tax=Halorussus amylolyticus TaxID=1126242 RepID=UPI00104C5853|nr:hypothetical protein [Halorussus amylolyticus]
MKRTVVGAAVGLGGAGAVLRADEAERNGSDAAQTDAGQTVESVRHPELVLVFANDYYSNALFRPIDRVPQRAVNAVLGHQTSGGNPVVSDPTDYNGYIVLVKQTPNVPGEYTFALVNEGTLQEDRWYRFTDDVVFFDARVGLLSVAVTTDGGVQETTTEATTTEATNAETTVRTSERTTHDVTVETAETNDGE